MRWKDGQVVNQLRPEPTSNGSDKAVEVWDGRRFKTALEQEVVVDSEQFHGTLIEGSACEGREGDVRIECGRFARHSLDDDRGDLPIEGNCLSPRDRTEDIGVLDQQGGDS